MANGDPGNGFSGFFNNLRIDVYDVSTNISSLMGGTGGAATSGLFALGGSFTSTVGNPGVGIFGYTGNTGQPLPELLLTTVSAVPLPATLPLFLSGLIGLGVIRRGRKTEAPSR